MSEGLFGDMPEKKKRGKSDGSVAQCFKRFEERFAERYRGKKPIFSFGKDGALFKRLIAADGIDDTLALIDEFFATTDPFAVMSDYTVGAFYVSAQRLRIRVVRVDRRLAENMDAAARAARGDG